MVIVEPLFAYGCSVETEIFVTSTGVSSKNGNEARKLNREVLLARLSAEELRLIKMRSLIPYYMTSEFGISSKRDEKELEDETIRTSLLGSFDRIPGSHFFSEYTLRSIELFPQLV